MYVPAAFAEPRLDAMHDLIDAHPLGALVRFGADGLDADHVPFELVRDGANPHGLLRAHVARANPLARQDGVDAMVVFQTASRYISPTLYDLEAAGGRAVPTWNYAVVHAHGRLRIVDDREWLLAHMRRAAARHEAPDGKGWKMEDAPPDFIERLVAATVGIEIPIARLEGKSKLSQNRSPAERKRIARAAGNGMPAG